MNKKIFTSHFLVIISLGFINTYLTSCTGQGEYRRFEKTQQQGKPSESTKSVTFKDVTPVFEQRCSRCHPGANPINWLDYEMAFKNKSKLLERVTPASPTMPPLAAPESTKITQEERDLIKAWVLAGAPLDTGDQTQDKSPTQPPVEAKPSIDSRINSCYGCHGNFGVSHTAGIPMIAGLSKTYLLNQLKDFSTEKRIDNSMNLMNGIAKDLLSNFSEDELDYLAEHFARLRPMKTIGDPTSEEKSRLEKLENNPILTSCKGCHYNQNANSISAEYPYLAGQNEQYIANQLANFKTGKRQNPMMNTFASSLTEEDIANISFYFSRQTPPYNQ